MGKLIYRLCLVVILVITVAVSVYYYVTFYREEEDPQKGTFVDRMDDAVKKAGKEIYEPVSEELKEKVISPAKAKGEQMCKTVQEKGEQLCKIDVSKKEERK